MISISCLESKLLNNNNWYGRFQLAPFQKGEGLTVANALRRTLLAEKSNFFITWVDFYNAEIPYSVLTGMRESIFDILLNLKQVIFTSDTILPNNSHFFKMPLNNNFSTQKVKFFSKSNLEPRINFLKEHGLNTASNNIINRAKQINQRGSIPANFNFIASPNLSLLKQTKPEMKQKAKPTQSIHDEISKNFTNYLFSVNRQKNPFKPWLNQSTNMIVPITKKNGISKTLKFQNFKNQKINLKTQNLFCENQILGKTINPENETSCLLPLKIFRTNVDLRGQFLNISNSKKMGDSTYIGYICAKGPATIYAKNIKLPKGLKCVDPDKYIATLADDGLFYLRFALTTEIKALPLNDTSNISISINKGIQFNTVRLKTFPKILLNKEIHSGFYSKIDPSMLKQEKKSKKSTQQYLYNSQMRFSGSHSIDSLKIKRQVQLENYYKQKYPLVSSRLDRASVFFNRPVRSRAENTDASHFLKKCDANYRFLWPFAKSKNKGSAVNEKKIDFLSPIELYDSKIGSVHYTKSLINKQRLLLTNDSIKQFNFQNTGITANIQKTCLLNIQIKHYYYKCGRFDRFLFDLIKPFKPTIKSIHYNNPFGGCGTAQKNKENIFGQPGSACTDSDWRVLTSFQNIFERQRSNGQLLIDYNRNDLKRPVLKNLIKKKHLINKLSNVFIPQSNVNFLSFRVESKNSNLNRFKEYLSVYSELPKSKYFNSSLIKWQKIFKSIKTNSIYDYLQKLYTNEATLICFLLSKPSSKRGISLLSSKLISNVGSQTKRLSFTLASLLKKAFNSDAFYRRGQDRADAYLRVNDEYKYHDLWMSKLYQPYIEKFLNISVSFQCSKNHILYFLKSYVLQYNSSSNLNKNSVPKKNILRDLLFKPNYMYTDKLITRIKFLRQWSSLMHKHSKKMKLINQSCLSSNKYQFLNSVRISTNLRAKPFISIRQVSYKPIWIAPYQFQQNKDKLWSKLGNKNLRGFEQTQTNKKWAKKGNLSYLAIKNKKTIFNPITNTNNSVVLKPVYLNVEQIIYILKQTTKFCKNKRINPVFIYSLNSLNNDNQYPLNYSLIFPKVYNSFYKPFRLNNTLWPLTRRPYFIDNKIQMSEKNTHRRALCRHVWILGNDFLFKNNSSYTTLKSQSYWPWKFTYHFNTTYQLPWVRNYELKLNLLGSFFLNILSARAMPSSFIHYNIFTKQYSVFYDSFYFWFIKQSKKSEKKELISHIPIKNTLGQKEMVKQFFFSRFSKYSILKKNYNKPLKCLLFRKDANEKNKFSESMFSTPLYTRPLENMDASLFFKNKNGESVQRNSNNYLSMFHVDYKSNVKNLHNEPYNINIYHSKISFNLRYTYPFKYTIFETFLPFVNFSKKIWYLPNLIQNDNFFSFFKNKNEKEKINKNYQLINDNRESTQILNSRIISSRNFDYIQYNQSFKIYTTLAYTCLKTYETHLPKYHNFNRIYQKKSQVMSFQPFESLITDWAAFQKNNQNWNFFTQYEKSYHEKPSAYPFFIIPDQLSTRFNSTYKWRIMNNPNFNDAFITIPCIWSLNFQLNASPNLTNLFYSFLPPLQKFYYVDSIFQNTYETMFLDSFEEAKQVVKNKLHWSKLNNTNNELNFIGLYQKKNTKAVHSEFQVNNKNYDEENTYDFERAEPHQKSSLLIPKFRIQKSLKKLAMSFENIYYKNFLWNSRKITLRVLNNAVLPLVANRKYSISDFIAKKNYQTRALMNMGMPRNSLGSPKFSTFPYQGKLWGLKDVSGYRETRPYLNFLNTDVWSHQDYEKMVSQRGSAHAEKNKITNHWLYQLSLSSHFSKIYNYQKPPFYSVRHKSLGTTNFMCSKIYPSSINENQINTLKPNFSMDISGGSSFDNKLSKGNASLFSQRDSARADKIEMLNAKFYSQETPALSARAEPRNFLQKNEKHIPDLTNESQTQRSDDSFSESFWSLRSKWRPFLTGSLRHSQEKDFSSESPFVNFMTQNKKSNKNSENQLLSYNKIINSQVLMDDPFRPEKLASLRKNRWIDRLIQGSKSSNLKDISKNDSKIKSPLITNLWSSSFFCRYSLYAISTKSDLFLQNLISLSDLTNPTRDESVWAEDKLKNTETSNSWIRHTNETEIFQTNLKVYKENLKEPFKKVQSQYERNNTDHLLNIKSSLKSYDKTIQKVLKSQDQKSANYFIPNYNYHWQKAVHFAILGRLKRSKFNDERKKFRSNWYKNQPKDFFLQYPKKNIDYTNQNSINGLKNQYSIRRFKNFERYFGNPLRRRRISQNGLSFYNIILSTKLYKQFATPKFKKANRHIIKSWKSIIWTIEADLYFCFRFPLLIQNCNLPWQKSKHLFGISKHWLNRITVYFKPPFKLTSNYLLKTVNINTELNSSLFMTYTQLPSSSHKTHEFLLSSTLLKNITSPVYRHIQNKGSYGMIGYFTIKESLNSIYKVNYIVESQAFESKLISELAFHSNQNNEFSRPRTLMESPHTMKKFENIQRDFVTTDSLTISNFLNGTYSFVPSKTIILRSFNELIDSKITKSKIENENEYIQIDIWTNGELSPRQALLNAFRKLFELFYNLSKYNCLKPIEI